MDDKEFIMVLDTLTEECYWKSKLVFSVFILLSRAFCARFQEMSDDANILAATFR